ncbi:hypothetical protein COO60DRAFT_1539616 [Scenedesmus sp. NREL 46B-D3]|nr:hypothetical protein COO60DRAFT_1539616 [Scenedesmus sp. NREL 46B-D3]
MHGPEPVSLLCVWACVWVVKCEPNVTLHVCRVGVARAQCQRGSQQSLLRWQPMTAAGVMQWFRGTPCPVILVFAPHFRDHGFT